MNAASVRCRRLGAISISLNSTLAANNPIPSPIPLPVLLGFEQTRLSLPLVFVRRAKSGAHTTTKPSGSTEVGPMKGDKSIASDAKCSLSPGGISGDGGGGGGAQMELAARPVAS